jgi:signal recognition particle receptor subunit beta
MRSNDMPPCTPLIVLANKQDLPRALTVDMVHARMGVAHVPNAYQPMTLGCCAVSGDGLETLLDSLHSVIVTSRRQRQTTAAASSGGGEAKQRSSGRNS